MRRQLEFLPAQNIVDLNNLDVSPVPPRAGRQLAFRTQADLTQNGELRAAKDASRGLVLCHDWFARCNVGALSWLLTEDEVVTYGAEAKVLMRLFLRTSEMMTPAEVQAMKEKLRPTGRVDASLYFEHPEIGSMIQTRAAAMSTASQLAAAAYNEACRVNKDLAARCEAIFRLHEMDDAASAAVDEELGFVFVSSDNLNSLNTADCMTLLGYVSGIAPNLEEYLITRVLLAEQLSHEERLPFLSLGRCRNTFEQVDAMLTLRATDVGDELRAKFAACGGFEECRWTVAILANAGAGDEKTREEAANAFPTAVQHEYKQADGMPYSAWRAARMLDPNSPEFVPNPAGYMGIMPGEVVVKLLSTHDSTACPIIPRYPWMVRSYMHWHRDNEPTEEVEASLVRPVAEYIFALANARLAVGTNATPRVRAWFGLVRAKGFGAGLHADSNEVVRLDDERRLWLADVTTLGDGVETARVLSEIHVVPENGLILLVARLVSFLKSNHSATANNLPNTITKIAAALGANHLVDPVAVRTVMGPAMYHGGHCFSQRLTLAWTAELARAGLLSFAIARRIVTNAPGTMTIHLLAKFVRAMQRGQFFDVLQIQQYANGFLMRYDRWRPESVFEAPYSLYMYGKSNPTDLAIRAAAEELMPYAAYIKDIMPNSTIAESVALSRDARAAASNDVVAAHQINGFAQGIATNAAAVTRKRLDRITA